MQNGRKLSEEFFGLQFHRLGVLKSGVLQEFNYVMLPRYLYAI